MSQAATVPGGGQDLAGTIAQRQALASQAPPVNRFTPNVRVDAKTVAMIDHKRIEDSLGTALKHMAGAENDPLFALFGAMHDALLKVQTEKIPVPQIVDAMALALMAMASPDTKKNLAQMISPPNPLGGGMMAPGQPPGAAGPAATAGPPPMGGAPVSPGPPG